jgi:hypothetical protein
VQLDLSPEQGGCDSGVQGCQPACLEVSAGLEPQTTGRARQPARTERSPVSRIESERLRSLLGCACGASLSEIELSHHDPPRSPSRILLDEAFELVSARRRREPGYSSRGKGGNPRRGLRAEGFQTIRAAVDLGFESGPELRRDSGGRVSVKAVIAFDHQPERLGKSGLGNKTRLCQGEVHKRLGAPRRLVEQAERCTAEGFLGIDEPVIRVSVDPLSQRLLVKGIRRSRRPRGKQKNQAQAPSRPATRSVAAQRHKRPTCRRVLAALGGVGHCQGCNA